MRTFPAMIDMRRDADEKSATGFGGICPQDQPEYDYGLGVSFNAETLKKLNLDSDVSVGDYLHIHAFAKVTGIHEDERNGEPNRRVDLVLAMIAAEDEDEEGDDEDEG